MKRRLLLITLLIFSGVNSFAQDRLLTVAESSNFTSTSNYKDVMTFIDHLRELSPLIRVENIAESVEGRDVPLLIIGKPVPKGPEELKNDGRIVIYVQANIHAGEVEGKEAVLMFARDLLSGKHTGLLDNVVFLLCPNFNPDGNEFISPLNRTYQNGPVNGVGVRYNGQMLDLNRDAMKVESPEVRGVIANVFNRWDPSVFMDCHTTNGSYHVEPVTFTWMVNPNGDGSLIKYMRDLMAPAMSKRLSNEYGVENCFYGEFNDMANPETGWFYDAAETRYMSNYFGLRNRLGILNENYVYADYESRVKGCYWLIRSLADYASANRDEIRDMIRKADAGTVTRGLNPAVTDSFAIEYEVKPAPEKATIKTYEAKLVGEVDGWKRYEKTDVQKTVTVPYYVDYYGTRHVKFPYAYLLKISDPDIVNLLAACLLEPQSNDGLMTWNYLDRYLVPQWGSGYNPYPVYKVIDKVDLKTKSRN